MPRVSLVLLLVLAGCAAELRPHLATLEQPPEAPIRLGKPDDPQAVQFEARQVLVRVGDLPDVDGLWPAGGGFAATVAIDRPRLVEWLEGATTRGRRASWSPRLTVLEGQAGQLASTIERHYVAGVDPSGEPILGIAEEGPRLRVTPLLAADGMAADLELELESALVEGFLPGPRVGEEAKVELPTGERARTSLRVRLARDHTLLLFRGRTDGSVELTLVGWSRVAA